MWINPCCAFVFDLLHAIVESNIFILYINHNYCEIVVSLIDQIKYLVIEIESSGIFYPITLHGKKVVIRSAELLTVVNQ